MSNRRYLSCAETAKLLRQALKESFPGVKFGVRSSVYSGGASIRVIWTDGPTVATVETVTGSFEGGYFDGMIDYQGARYHTLDGESVRFGATFIFEERALSRPRAEALAGAIAEQYGRSDWATIVGGEAWGYRVMQNANGPSIKLAYDAHDARLAAIEPKESATLARVKFTGDDGYGAGTVGPDGSGRQTSQGYPRSAVNQRGEL